MIRSSAGAVKRLSIWLSNLHDDFGDQVPPPTKALSVVTAIERRTNAPLMTFIEAGTNGAAFRTTADTVIKFTIDEQEAVLWGQLWGTSHKHVAECYGSWQLASRDAGATILYVVHVEYVPHPLDKRLAELLTTVGKDAWRLINSKTGRSTSSNEMTMDHLRTLRTAAKRDPRLQELIDVIVDLSDMGVHIYDLQPDNFRLDDAGHIRLVDPSTPRGATGRPRTLVYEQVGIGVGHILF